RPCSADFGTNWGSLREKSADGNPRRLVEGVQARPHGLAGSSLFDAPRGDARGGRGEGSQMRKLLVGAVVAMALALAFVPPREAAAQTVPAAVLADLAPTGALRFGIPLANSPLTTRDPATGELRGLVPD